MQRPWHRRHRNPRGLGKIRAAFESSGGRGTVAQRVRILQTIFLIAAVILLGRLFRVQLVDAGLYRALAEGQHDIYRELFPERGDIFVSDKDGGLMPIAANEDRVLIAADLRKVENPTRAAKILADNLGLDELELKSLLSGKDDPYEPIAHFIPKNIAEKIRAAELAGILLIPETKRIYPEPAMGGHLVGFFGSDSEGNYAGRYGVERSYNNTLAGEQGYISGERDPAGRLIPFARTSFRPAKDGADIVLTIDRNIQAFACSALAESVERHSADGGSVAVLDPKSGAVLAMCGFPDFDPNVYEEAGDISVFNNPAVFGAYEPGSIFKPITMAAALEYGLDPETAYNDEGFVKIGVHTIWNSDNEKYGRQNMTDVLQKSLNTGIIFAMRQIGTQKFRDYVERFGFGEPTGIDLAGESPGNISVLKERGEIFHATASFGQGITVTPIQMAQAFAAIANGGVILRPYVVREIREPNGDIIQTEKEVMRQVISGRTSMILGAMLVNVVEKGHGKRAGVPGYYIAGKTGTAQVPKKDGPGYEPGLTIGSFAGFGPVDDPVFVMVVRIDHPRDVMWAESSAAPLFGKIAKFILQYYGIPPIR